MYKLKNKMQKMSLALMLLAVTTACSDHLVSEMEIEYSSVPLGFSCIDEQATRGNQTTTTEVKSFVTLARYYNESSSYGRDFFEGQVISKNSSGKWQYDPVKYWPKSGSVDFYAYSPQDIQGTFESLTLNHIIYPSWMMRYTVKEPQITSVNELNGSTISSDVFGRAKDATQQQDLLLAVTPNQLCADKVEVNNPVNFTFKHAMAGLKFQFKAGYTFPTDATHVILAIAPMCTGGTIAFDPSSADPIHWTIDESEATFYQGYTITTGQIDTEDKTFFLPPQKLKNFTIIARFYKQEETAYTLLATKTSNKKELELKVGETLTIKLGPE